MVSSMCMNVYKMANTKGCVERIIVFCHIETGCALLPIPLKSLIQMISYRTKYLKAFGGGNSTVGLIFVDKLFLKKDI